jgi:hypothetical protein
MELIEDANVPVVESDTMTTLQRQFEARPIRIDHNLYKSNAPWPTKTDVWCFHCAHPFNTMPVPMVARYDHDRSLAVCFGNFCSPNCGRAYALDHRPLSWSQAVGFYTKILRDCFGIPAETRGRAAWPKERLKTFGGDLTIEEFREGFSTPLVMRVENVSFCMQNLSIVEVSPDRGSGVPVGIQEDTDLAADEETRERKRLRALASQVIRNTRNKGKRAVEEDDDDDDDDDDHDDHDEKEDNDDESSRERTPPQPISSTSVLATFLENMRVYKGDEKAVRSVMVDARGPLARAATGSSDSTSQGMAPATKKGKVSHPAPPPRG